MKISIIAKASIIFFFLLSVATVKAQQNEDLLNLLIKKKLLTQQEADSIRADQALKAQEQKDKQSKFTLSIGKALNLKGLLQVRYQAFQAQTGNDGFDIRRARFDINGAITEHWEYDLYTEFATNVKVLDAFTAYRFNNPLKITVGQFKVPFSLESITSDSQLQFIDRAQVVEALSSRTKDVLGNNIGRDIGAQLSGSFIKLDDRYLFDYSLGMFNGAGYDVSSDNNKNKDIAGRLVIHPLKNLDLGADIYKGQDIPAATTKAPTPETQTRDRYSIDAKYITGQLSVTAEYANGTDGNIKKDGWYLAAGYYLVAKKLEAVARYDTFDASKASLTDRTNWYIGGLNYYFNTWSRLALNYSYRREEGPQIKNNLLSAQVQIQF